MVATDYDYTIYEVEGSITELAKIENSELLDKKVNNVVMKEATLDLRSKDINQQMHLYLETIQKLKEEDIVRLLSRFGKYAHRKTNV